MFSELMIGYQDYITGIISFLVLAYHYDHVGSLTTLCIRNYHDIIIVF